MESKSTVLLVDDNPTTLEVMQLLLTGAEYRLLFAENGSEAILKASKFSPDLILLDVLLPEMDGFEVCRRLRADDNLSDVPIVMVSALDDEKSCLQGIEVGADDFITKPFNSEEFKARVKNITRLNRYRRLRAERHRFEQLVSLSPDGILIVDEEGNIQHSNGAMSDILKLRGEVDLTGQKINTLVSNDSINRVFGGFQWLGQNINQSIHMLAFLQDSNGARIPVELNCQTILWKNQRNMLMVIRDFTEHEHLLDRIRRGVEDWQATFDAVKDMMILTGLDGKIIRCNRVTLEYFHSNFSDMLDKNISTVFFGEGNSPNRMIDLKGEIQFPRLSGWFEIYSYPVMEAERVEKYVFSIRDITLVKEIEEKVTASQRLTDIGILAAGVTHDIKSPLQVITGRIESLLKQLDSEEEIDKEYLVYSLENVKRNAWRIENVMRSLLNYAHQSSNEADYYDINELIKDSMILIEHQLMIWANISINVELCPDLPRVYCDQHKISQVLVNLLMNARDAMPSGGEIIIRSDYDEKENRVVLQVIDTGIGIPAEIMDKIFDPFFTTKPVGQGTGLGLSNVKKIVEGCGGTIYVKNHQGGGTIFTLAFPKSYPD